LALSRVFLAQSLPQSELLKQANLMPRNKLLLTICNLSVFLNNIKLGIIFCRKISDMFGQKVQKFFSPNLVNGLFLMLKYHLFMFLSRKDLF